MMSTDYTITKDEYRALVAERDKLRAARDVWQENDAKLRELVRDMWRNSVMHMSFADRYAFIGEFVGRMRELGMEVVTNEPTQA